MHQGLHFWFEIAFQRGPEMEFQAESAGFQ